MYQPPNKREYDNISEILWEKYCLGVPSEEQNDKKFTNELQAKVHSIRQNRKFNFWMNRGLTKLSTIHSFKGWEINTLVLIIDSTENSTDELVYTGLTRCANNIIIINIGNLKYYEFFKSKMHTRKITITACQENQAEKAFLDKFSILDNRLRYVTNSFVNGDNDFLFSEEMNLIKLLNILASIYEIQNKYFAMANEIMHVRDLVVNRKGTINNERLERTNGMMDDITKLIDTF